MKNFFQSTGKMNNDNYYQIQNKTFKNISLPDRGPKIQLKNQSQQLIIPNVINFPKINNKIKVNQNTSSQKFFNDLNQILRNTNSKTQQQFEYQFHRKMKFGKIVNIGEQDQVIRINSENKRLQEKQNVQLKSNVRNILLSRLIKKENENKKYPNFQILNRENPLNQSMEFQKQNLKNQDNVSGNINLSQTFGKSTIILNPINSDNRQEKSIGTPADSLKSQLKNINRNQMKLQESLKSRDSGISKSYKIDFIDQYYQARNFSTHELLNQSEDLERISKYNWSKQNSSKQRIDLRDNIEIRKQKIDQINMKQIQSIENAYKDQNQKKKSIIESPLKVTTSVTTSKQVNSSRSSYKLQNIIDLEENKIAWTERAKQHIVENKKKKVTLFDSIEYNSSVIVPVINIDLVKIQEDNFNQSQNQNSNDDVQRFLPNVNQKSSKSIKNEIDQKIKEVTSKQQKDNINSQKINNLKIDQEEKGVSYLSQYIQYEASADNLSEIDDEISLNKIQKMMFKDEKKLKVKNLQWLQNSREQRLRKIELLKVNNKRSKISTAISNKTQMQKMAKEVLSSIYCYDNHPYAENFDQINPQVVQAGARVIVDQIYQKGNTNYHSNSSVRLDDSSSKTENQNENELSLMKIKERLISAYVNQQQQQQKKVSLQKNKNGLYKIYENNLETRNQKIEELKSMLLNISSQSFIDEQQILNQQEYII